MKSTDLPDFSSWLNWPGAIQQAPDRLGVYVFRLAGKTFGRFKGESDIVYIGCAGEQSIQGRLRSHLPSRTDILDIARRLNQMGQLQVAWKIVNTQQEAMHEEERLLDNHDKDHLELPPVNRSKPGKKIRQLTELLAQIDPTKSPEDVYEIAKKLFSEISKAI